MLAAVLDLGIDLDVWPWIWLGTAVLFALVELIVVGGSFIILPFAVSAFIAAILAFYDVSIEIQWAVFVFGGALLFAIMYQWAQRFMREHTMAPGVGADRLVGLVGIVTREIDPDDSTRNGRVTIDGEIWGVADAARRFGVGDKVTVTAMRGTRVIVSPIEPDDTDDADDADDQDNNTTTGGEETP
jgi:membrane protein implicated in regulation of membrane protease activity